MRTRQLMDELRDALGSDGHASVVAVAPGASAGRSFAPVLPCGPAPANAELMARLRAATIAQIGVGRAGVRLRTRTLLKFLGDRAVAVEAVRSRLPEDFASRLGAVAIHSEAADLDEFLLRPDLGRRIPPKALEQVRAHCAPRPDVQVVVGDGLSAQAVALNAPPLLEALGPELARHGLRTGTTVLVERARMKTLDVIGEAVGARTALILLGERPGLGTGDGMSAYLVFRPRADAVESDHEVVSNIHARGIPPAEAARKIADLLAELVRTGKSGVPRQATAGATAVDRSRVEPSSKVETVGPRAPWAGQPIRRELHAAGGSVPPGPPRRDPQPPLAVSASARCAG